MKGLQLREVKWLAQDHSYQVTESEMKHRRARCVLQRIFSETCLSNAWHPINTPPAVLFSTLCF